MFKSYPIILRFTVFLVLPLVVFLILGVNHLRSSLPQTEKDIINTGVQEPVNIARDQKGVVYIEGKTDRDVFFAMGFAHAQDRMWQLELQRRIAQGKLSEVFGKNTVSQDAWMRTLGLYEAAESSWSSLGKEAQSSLTAYTAGINAWLNSSSPLPPEFDILGIQPEPWKEVDSLAWIKVFALNLSNNMWYEIRNSLASQVLNQSQMATLLSGYPVNAPTTISKVDQKTQQAFSDLLTLQKQVQDQLKIGGKYVGSNAWVVSGKLTESGQSILANDPHLGLQIPSLWYVANLKGDQLNVSGMTLVGLPIVIFGQNHQIAWGGTNMMADVQDLYVEQINPANSKQYRFQGEWEKFQTRTEFIQVRADFPSDLRTPLNPIKIKIRKTNHGPIISDLNHLDQPISLRWTALEPNDTTYEAFFRLNYATDWKTFKESLKFYVAPSLNMLYSDKNKNIGYLGAGKIPIRSKGEGQFPVPSWTNDYKWEGYIPFEDWPQSYNPEKGYLVSANNKVVSDDYPHFISHDWAPPTRAQRIEQLLQEKIQKKKGLSLDDMKEIQADTVDLSAIQLIEILKNLPPKNQRQKLALNYLQNWKGEMDESSQAASIFYVWMKHLREQLFADELRGDWFQPEKVNVLQRIVSNTTHAQIYAVLINQPDQENWCDNVNTNEITEKCNDSLFLSLELALDELEKLRGSDLDSWSWGELHSVFYAHTPFSQIKFLDLIFERRISNGGSPNTINVATATYKKSEGYEQTFGAGFRQIMQLDPNQSQHFYMGSTGQSGHIFNDHYDDMVEPFRNVQYYHLSEFSELKTSSSFQIRPR